MDNLGESQTGFMADLPDRSTGGDGFEASQYVAFSIGEQQFCIDIMAVREIRAWDGATSLPNSADYVRGVINLRGNVVPVIDLKARFGQGETDTENGNVVVIVMIGDKLHGLLVDAVSGILTVAPDGVAPVPQTGGDNHTGLLSGIITDNEQMVAVIALDALN